MRRYFSIGFIDFMLESKSLLYHTNLFSPKEYENNDQRISKSFRSLRWLRWKKYFALFAVSIENLKTLKYHTFSKKKQPLISQTLVFLILTTSVKMKRNEYSKKKNELRY